MKEKKKKKRKKKSFAFPKYFFISFHSQTDPGTLHLLRGIVLLGLVKEKVRR